MERIRALKKREVRFNESFQRLKFYGEKLLNVFNEMIRKYPVHFVYIIGIRFTFTERCKLIKSVPVCTQCCAVKCTVYPHKRLFYQPFVIKLIISNVQALLSHRLIIT